MNVTDPRAPTRNKSTTTNHYDKDTLHVIEDTDTRKESGVAGRNAIRKHLRLRTMEFPPVSSDMG